jgi:hypothetical protein
MNAMKCLRLVHKLALVMANHWLSDKRPSDAVLRRMQPLRAPFCPACLTREIPVPCVPYWGLNATINFKPTTATPDWGRDLATCRDCGSVMAVTYPMGKREVFLWFLEKHQSQN